MSNDVVIHGRNMEVSERLEDYVTKRASRLDRFLSGIDEARVELSHSKTARNANDRQVAQITVRGKKFILRSEERSADIYSAFDRALDKIARQISRYKGKHYRGRGDGATIGQIATERLEEEEIEELEADEEYVIARRKQFTILPMDEMEAIEQMKMLGHENFFVFFNADSSKINVLYQRRDGTYGLIEPELG